MNNILILMAGEGTRMTHTNIPKPFIEFNHVPLFHHCSESFDRKDKNNHFIFVVQKKHLIYLNIFNNFIKNNYSNYSFILQNGKKNGPVESALEAKKIINSKKKLFILDCDQYNIFSPEKMIKFVKKNNFDGSVLVTLSEDLTGSHVLSDENNIILDINEKEKFYKYSSSGVYYWSSGKLFVKLSKKYLKNKKNNKEIFISEIYKYAIKLNFIFLKFNSEKTLSAGDSKKYFNFIEKIYF